VRKQINSQETRLGLAPPLTKKPSKLKETSIERRDRVNSENKRPRNISLPNLKKKPSNRNRRLKNTKRKTKANGPYSKEKTEKWGELFFHYF
jgi:hypothetical protein